LQRAPVDAAIAWHCSGASSLGGEGKEDDEDHVVVVVVVVGADVGRRDSGRAPPAARTAATRLWGALPRLCHDTVRVMTEVSATLETGSCAGAGGGSVPSAPAAGEDEAAVAAAATTPSKETFGSADPCTPQK
jgi:hypothetical protein